MFNAQWFGHREEFGKPCFSVEKKKEFGIFRPRHSHVKTINFEKCSVEIKKALFIQ